MSDLLYLQISVQTAHAKRRLRNYPLCVQQLSWIRHVNSSELYSQAQLRLLGAVT